MSDHIRSGIHPELEAVANELIFGSLKGVTSQSAKSDVLTPWKEQDRRSREVMAHQGFVDPALRRGMYHRAANTRQSYLNARDGAMPGGRAARRPGSFLGDWPTNGSAD